MMAPSNLPPCVSDADIEAQVGDERDDGGPAFPVLRVSRSDFYSIGMTLRDYFIAHAPHRPQDWFIPVMDRECPVVPSEDACTPEQREDIVMEWEASGGTEWAKDWCEKRAAAEEAQKQWQAEFRKELLLQWPGAWADEQLKRRAR